MKKEFNGKIRLGGKEYAVKVLNGERLVEVCGKWLSPEEFLKTLPQEIKENLAFVGEIALKDEMEGKKPEKGKYQYLAEDLPNKFK